MDNNLREVNDDLMKEWFQFREESKFCYLTEEDKKHFIHFEKISKNILNSIPEKNRQYVKKQLNQLDRNGFCDGMELIKGS